VLAFVWLADDLPPETFHDQAAWSSRSFCRFTWGVGMGGPAALALSHQGIKQIRAAPCKERMVMARTGIALSCIMIFAGIVLLVSWLFIMFSR
jgi:hypothetical protein